MRIQIMEWKGCGKEQTKYWIFKSQLVMSIASYSSGWHWHPTIYHRFFLGGGSGNYNLGFVVKVISFTLYHGKSSWNQHVMFVFLQASSGGAKSQIQAIFPSPLGQSQVIQLGGAKSLNPTGFQWPCRVQRQEPNRKLHQVNVGSFRTLKRKVTGIWN